nr:MAG: hypothetical protein [Caudoviricetes sp.]
MFYNTNLREYTCKLLDAVDEGLIDPKAALASALTYISEADVKDMCMVNEFFIEEEDEEESQQEDIFNDFNYVGSRDHY